MTNDEAKSVLFDMLGKGIYVKNTKENQAILAGLRALEQEPCNDAISRKAVLENAINVLIAKIVTEDKVICRKVIFADNIEKLPPVTPQSKTGQWIKEDAIFSRCSECGTNAIVSNWSSVLSNYCPNCGAKMEVEE